jgi:hypothetical protein
MKWPAVPGLFDMPTIATERGRINFSTPATRPDRFP